MNPFIGQMVCFGGNFAPRGWALCQGQLLDIASHTALFSILGTTYGGDGRTTFKLPDLRGRLATQQGRGPGLRTWSLGEQAGSESHTLVLANLPQIPVNIPVSDGDKASDSPSGAFLTSQDDDTYASAATTGESYGSNIHIGGSSQAVSNIQPTLGLNWLIALVGTYPSRS